MKWLKYVCFLSLGQGAVLNLEHFHEDITVATEGPTTRELARPVPQAKRAPAQVNSASYGMDPMAVVILDAIQKNPPNGRSWEHLEQEEFAIEVEKWVEEILEAAGIEYSDQRAMAVWASFYKYSDPYMRYLGFTLMYRNNSETKTSEDLLMLLSEHPHITEDVDIEDVAEATHERMVRHKLVTELIERFGSNLVSDLKYNLSEKEWNGVRTRMHHAIERKSEHRGLMKIDMLMDRID